MDICRWCDETFDTHCVDCEACFDEHSIDCIENELPCDWCENAIAERIAAYNENWAGAMNVCGDCDLILEDKLIDVILSV